MVTKVLLFLFFCLAGASLRPLPTLASDEETWPLCENIHVQGELLKLTTPELSLICGTAQPNAWKEIPFSQAIYFLKRFLQQRGYHQATFEILERKLFVRLHSFTRVTRLTEEGLPSEIKLERKRKIKGEVLTPTLLNHLEEWVHRQLLMHGHACPQVDISADPLTGSILVRVHPGPVYILQNPSADGAEDVNPAILSRFYAFEPGNILHGDWLKLTERRLTTRGSFLSAYHTLNCDKKKILTVKQHIVSGKPRLITAGVGANTEGILLGKVMWRHARLSSHAHSAGIAAYASFLRQALEAEMKFHPFLQLPRFHLLQKFSIERRAERRYESARADVSLTPGISWDNQEFEATLYSGPAYSYSHLIRGTGPVNARSLSWLAHLDFLSHAYELFATDPQAGWRVGLHFRGSLSGVASDFTAQELSLEGQSLWNLGGYDPPLFIFGVRSQMGTLLIPEGSTSVSSLPPEMRFFLGGQSNLRGFGRASLPSDGSGYLTWVYAGAELRLHEVFPYSFDPLIFFDTAVAGRSSLALDSDIYCSPGLGLRWASPIGPFRVSFSRGQLCHRDRAAVDSRWQFYFSYGEEF